MILNPETIIAGRYEIVDRLGAGGMAIVYRARDKKLDRFVTLKVMREEFTQDEEFITRFNIEASAAASLSHMNIVNVYDVGQEGLIYYIVMEYVEGVTLKELIQRRAPFSNEETIGVGIQIANALQHAHQNKIVHRDIKPENILVTEKGIIKVTDFGIARAVSSTTVSADTTIGSVYYFSPEQARGGFVDGKSDLYSLGIVLFEMVTGVLPFNGESAVSIALKHINETIPDIRAYNDNISMSLLRIIQKATQKSTLNRYERADLLAEDLKKALKDDTGAFMEQSDAEEFTGKTIRISEQELQSIRNDGKEALAKEQAIEDQNVTEIMDGYDVERYEAKQRKSSERKIILAALITSVFIIAIISFFGYGYIKELRPKAIPIEKLQVDNQLFETAANMVSQYGIQLKQLTPQYNDTVPEGYIISSDVGEGRTTLLYPGDSIEVVVSLGSKNMKIPNFLNRDVYTVALEFKNYDLDFLTFIEEETDNMPSNMVIRQDPPAGTLVERGSAVQLYISKKKQIEEIVVPDFSNMPETQAIELARDIGLVTQNSEQYPSKTVAKGNVIAQTITKGTKVTKGSIIAFQVSSGNAETTPSPSPSESTPPTEEPALVKKSLVLDPPIPEGVESVHLRILELKEIDGVIVFNEKLHVEQFPFTLEVQGKGTITYLCYLGVDDEEPKFYAEEKVHFDGSDGE